VRYVVIPAMRKATSPWGTEKSSADDPYDGGGKRVGGGVGDDLL